MTFQWAQDVEGLNSGKSINLVTLSKSNLKQRNTLQKQMFYKKGVLKDFAKFKWNTCARVFFNKVFLKQRLWHRCFPVNFAQLFRAPIWKKTSGRLLLALANTKTHLPMFHHNDVQCTEGINLVVTKRSHILKQTCSFQLLPPGIKGLSPKNGQTHSKGNLVFSNSQRIVWMYLTICRVGAKTVTFYQRESSISSIQGRIEYIFLIWICTLHAYEPFEVSWTFRNSRANYECSLA